MKPRSRLAVGLALIGLIVAVVLNLARPEAGRQSALVPGEPRTPGLRPPRVDGGLDAPETTGFAGSVPSDSSVEIVRDVLVRGVVLDVFGTPLAGGTVTVRGQRGFVETAAVGNTGQFELVEAQSLGRRRVFYSSVSHCCPQTWLSIRRTEQVVLYVEELTEFGVVVVDADGKPVRSAKVWGNVGPEGCSAHATTDGDGRCSIHTVPSPHVSASARGPDGERYGWSPPLLVEAARRDGLRVVLDRTYRPVRLFVRSAPGSESLSGLPVQITSGQSETFPIETVSATIDGPAAEIRLHLLETDHFDYVGPIRLEPQGQDSWLMWVSPRSLRSLEAGDSLVAYAEDSRYLVTVAITDEASRPVPYFELELRRTDVTSDGLSRAPIRVETDEAGRAAILCARGTYEGPTGPIVVDGADSVVIRLPGAAYHGVAFPAVGHVQIVDMDAGRPLPLGVQRTTKVPVRSDGYWSVLADAAPGTRLEAHLLDEGTGKSLASTPAVPGIDTMLEVGELRRFPHRTHVHVERQGRVVICSLAVRSQPHGVFRSFPLGLRRFDLSTLPPGEYTISVNLQVEVARMETRVFGPYAIGSVDQEIVIEL